MRIYNSGAPDLNLIINRIDMGSWYLLCALSRDSNTPCLVYVIGGEKNLKNAFTEKGVKHAYGVGVCLCCCEVFMKYNFVIITCIFV